MKRRSFLLGTLAAGATVGLAGFAWLSGGPEGEKLTIPAALQALDKLMESDVVTLGEWNLAQVFVHCAQSVEFSMQGFPEHKSDFFKATAGSMAFAVFSARGEMAHGLNEAIPGAPSLKLNADTHGAYQRFRESMLAFEEFQGQLAPHFAYGSLTKVEYERAHAMHFYNHLDEIQAVVV